MDEKQFQKELNQALDFDTVLKQIAGFSTYEPTKKVIQEALPFENRLDAMEKLDLAKEALIFVQKGNGLSMSGLPDISKSVALAKKKSVLTGIQISQVFDFLTAVSTIKRTLSQAEDSILLKDMADSLDPLPKLASSIKSKIGIDGEVKEDATSTLKSLSRKLANTRSTLAEKTRSFMKANSNRLMESVSTTIDGRVCVLVKAADKYAFGGMIHGQSQSGQAFYVEPQALVGLNNDIVQIRMDIDEEKKRICRELTQQIEANAIALNADEETMLEIDLAFTKAKWAYRYDGVIPYLSKKDRDLSLENAWHPLLDEKKAVQNNYEMKDGIRCIMISGPNMGGKTVTLKTIGLFIALSHAGFPVLAHRALIPWFESMYFDIGDNQSIENNLSTFSAHISKISQIVNDADPNSFILLDEIGNGTDPSEGASLAIAVLEDLMDQNSSIVTSTHYNEVKSFGKTDPRVLVSSVEFDMENLRPTYRYLPGITSASFAFSIADTFHLKKSVIERAEALKKENESQVEKQMQALEKEQMKVQKDKERFERMLKDVHRIQKEADEKEKKLEKREKAMEKDYEERLTSMLEKKEAEADKLLKTIKETGSMKLHEQIEKKHELERLGVIKKEEEKVDGVFKKGDYVVIAGLGLHGQIEELKKKKAVVMINGKKTTVDLSRLEHANKPKASKSIRKADHEDRVFTTIPMELNIIGMRVAEGIEALDHYIDQAVYHNMTQVRIIHGMGTGALRNAVIKDLKSHPQVKSFQAGGPSEGGLGATIVTLK